MTHFPNNKPTIADLPPPYDDANENTTLIKKPENYYEASIAIDGTTVAPAVHTELRDSKEHNRHSYQLIKIELNADAIEKQIGTHDALISNYNKQNSRAILLSMTGGALLSSALISALVISYVIATAIPVAAAATVTFFTPFLALAGGGLLLIIGGRLYSPRTISQNNYIFDMKKILLADNTYEEKRNFLLFLNDLLNRAPANSETALANAKTFLNQNELEVEGQPSKQWEFFKTLSFEEKYEVITCLTPTQRSDVITKIPVDQRIRLLAQAFCNYKNPLP